MNTCLYLLRPRLRPRFKFQIVSTPASRFNFSSDPGISGKELAGDAQKRLEELHSSNEAVYPRFKPSHNYISLQDFQTTYEDLKPDKIIDSDLVTIRGRINSIRESGSKLIFIDIIQNRHQVQGVCELSTLQRGSSIIGETFPSSLLTLRRGDIISLEGYPYRTKRGQISLRLFKVPELLSPCLHRLPTTLQDNETRIRHRHVDFLVNRKSAERILVRSEVISYLRHLLVSDGCTELQTPILADAAGGAIARPFQTSSVEFADRQLSLRIAPELWLKRLVLGGIDRVFEIGQCFRNEGLDLNHNPEFTTCEFYRTYTDLEELIDITEKILSKLAIHISSRLTNAWQSIQHSKFDFSIPFRRLDFIPEIESATHRKLPDLSSPNAEAQLIQFFLDCKLNLPASPTIPRLLDKLSSVYLEPQCIDPTFIIYHPECISPLSKSFTHPSTGQKVAARAELFVNNQEIINTYEEENSPVEQRRKFVEQLRYREEGDPDNIDENYLQALEWGLPPTGGWGCGIDRLCMLMSSSTRIGDVLPFGTLRNTIALGRKLPSSDLK